MDFKEYFYSQSSPAVPRARMSWDDMQKKAERLDQDIKKGRIKPSHWDSLANWQPLQQFGRDSMQRLMRQTWHGGTQPASIDPTYQVYGTQASRRPQAYTDQQNWYIPISNPNDPYTTSKSIRQQFGRKAKRYIPIETIQQIKTLGDAEFQKLIQNVQGNYFVVVPKDYK